MDMEITGLDTLSDDEFREIEVEADKLVSVWHIKSSVANNDNWHDDQHIGQKRRDGWSRPYLTGPGLTTSPVPPRQPPAGGPRSTLPPIATLEGNFLFHPPTTWIFEFNDDGSMVRVLSWTFGIEGLSQEREKPFAIVSMMRSGATMVRVNGKWIGGGGGAFSRTTKNDHPKDWVHHMRQTSTRPPMTMEADRNALGKYAYRPFEVRVCVPAAPGRDTWKKYPEFADPTWATIYLPDASKPAS